MLKKIINTINGFTDEDLLSELVKPVFNGLTLNKIYTSGINIHWVNKNGETFLHFCASKNRGKSLLWLIEKKVNIDATTKDRLTPLFYAVESNSNDCIEILINNGANVDCKNRHNRTVLQEAVISNNNHNVIDLLMKHSKELNNLDNYGHNVIFDAISNGDRELIKKIAENKDVNLNQIDENGQTILHQKAVLNDNDLALTLMQCGADPTIKDNTGKSFLFYSAAKGIESEEIIDKAVTMGCDLNSLNSLNQTILMETLLAFSNLTPAEINRRKSLLHMARKLVKEGVDINIEDKNSETALFIAVRNRDIDSVLLLINEHGININHQNKNGETVLSIATLKGISNLDLILILLNNDANPNIKDIKGKSIVEKLIDAILHYHNGKKIEETLNDDGQYLVVLKEFLDNSNVDLRQLNSNGIPLFYEPIFFQNNKLFKILKSFGIDVNQKDKYGRSILHNFMDNATDKYGFKEKEYLKVLKYLISIGIDLNCKDKKGNSPTQKAVSDKCESTVRLFLDSKTNIKTVDNHGRNLIHSCVWKAKVRHFKLINSYNKDILNEADSYGILPIHYAAFMGHSELVLNMIEFGAYINNTNQVSPKMKKFLSNHICNLDSLIDDIDCTVSKRNILILIENMKKEFI